MLRLLWKYTESELDRSKAVLRELSAKGRNRDTFGWGLLYISI